MRRTNIELFATYKDAEYHSIQINLNATIKFDRAVVPCRDSLKSPVIDLWATNGIRSAVCSCDLHIRKCAIILVNMCLRVCCVC